MTDKQDSLEAIFTELRSGKLPQDDIVALRDVLTPDDTDWMMQRVAALTSPYEYMQDVDETDADDNARSAVITDGYFKFIDLVSCYILGMGSEAIARARAFEQSDAHYVPWVLRYCSNARARAIASLPIPRM